MSISKPPEYKPKTNPYLPIIGLVLAIMLGIIAYFASPYLTDLLIENVENLQTRIAEEPDGERNLRIAVGVLVWIAALAVSMMFVGIGTSRSLVEEEAQTLRPREMTEKQLRKYEEELARNREKKRKMIKKLKKKKEREERGDWF